jgi:SAM-dependent methyltransferase
MPLDSRNLRRFYDSPRGQIARRYIARRLGERMGEIKGQRLLGVGYVTPFLRPFLESAERVIAAEPVYGRATPWPREGRALSASVEEHLLPFPDAFFDRVLVIHGLETADSTRRFLREIWRVLADEGRLILVVPNRVSFWAQLERTPFGFGHPFSNGQLQRLLEDMLFEVEQWDTALFIPPFGWRAPRLGQAFERLGHRFWPRLSGVHIVEATKSLYAGVPADSIRARRRRRILAKAR